MWFAYIDESKDQNRFFVYSALLVNSDEWNAAFDAVKNLRIELRKSFGIYISKELHASKFCAGKGRISDRVIDKAQRAEIFNRILHFISTSGFFKVISAVNTSEFYCFERFVNRINRTAEAKKQFVTLFCDEGQEAAFRKRIRRMKVHNPIPSNQGAWADTGAPTRNITINRIIEDPVFKDSKNSYFIQLVDFVAYALLRMERHNEARNVYGYDNFYATLEPALYKVVNRRDPRGLGIIR